MRPILVLAIISLGTAGCSNHNLLGEEVWADERLAQAKVGFGWNYEVESEEASSRNIDILIQPDNSFQISISEYRNDAELELLNQDVGNLAPAAATRLRRKLAQLRSGNEAELFTTMPGCPAWSHPAIEYLIGFETAEARTVTIIERGCETPGTVEGRKIISDAMVAFPQIVRAKLVAGSVDL